MSAVYRAYDTVMGREVALKRLLPVEETNLNEAAGEALAREAAALARFSHPNVVTVFAFEEDSEGPYVVMELVEGEDLHTIMKSGALSWEDFRDVAAQCLEPLVAASELNLLHRDIKPGNIMLTVTASGRFLVKVLDFGLSKFSQQPSLQTLDQRGSFLGSIDFIAPEQLELRPLDQRTDLYSLGCVLYYMLAQESPFTGSNPAETSMNHLRHRCTPIAERRTDLPPLVADWIMRLISRDPEDRPGDAREALSQYQDALKGIPFTRPDREDEIPFAETAVPAATGPVGPPVERPPDPPTAPPSTRILRTASGPVTAGRRATGPLTGAQAPRVPTARQASMPAATGPQRSARTGPQRSMTGPQRSGGTGPHRSRATGPSSPARTGGAVSQDPSGTMPWKWIVAAVGGGLLILSLFFLLRGGADSSRGKTTVASAPESSPEVSRPLAPLAYPAALPSPAAGTTPPALPVTDGLYARFVSSVGVFGRDYTTAPAPGQPVAAWQNLAFPDKERSLLRDGGDPKGEQLPVLREAGATEAPGLAGRLRGITTTNRSSLTMLKHPGVLPAGFTLVAVMRIEAGEDRLFRIQPPTPDGTSFSVATGYDAKVTAVHKGRADGPEVRTSIPWPSGTPGVLMCVFDPVAKEQRISARPAAGTAPAMAKGTIETYGSAFGTVGIGKRGFGDSFDAETGNVYFEIVLYDRVLDEAELRTLSEALAGRYFAKGG
jgi:serine/threonine protein kinase